MKKAECRGTAPSNGNNSPDKFFPAKSENSDEAILKHCFKCPVTEECNAHGNKIGAVHGVWGGVRRTPASSKG
jgi:hypothetical protein